MARCYLIQMFDTGSSGILLKCRHAALVCILVMAPECGGLSSNPGPSSGACWAAEWWMFDARRGFGIVWIFDWVAAVCPLEAAAASALQHWCDTCSAGHDLRFSSLTATVPEEDCSRLKAIQRGNGNDNWAYLTTNGTLTSNQVSRKISYLR